MRRQEGLQQHRHLFQARIRCHVVFDQSAAGKPEVGLLLLLVGGRHEVLLLRDQAIATKAEFKLLESVKAEVSGLQVLRGKSALELLKAEFQIEILAGWRLVRGWAVVKRNIDRQHVLLRRLPNFVLPQLTSTQQFEVYLGFNDRDGGGFDGLEVFNKVPLTEAFGEAVHLVDHHLSV